MVYEGAKIRRLRLCWDSILGAVAEAGGVREDEIGTGLQTQEIFSAGMFLN